MRDKGGVEGAREEASEGNGSRDCARHKQKEYADNEKERSGMIGMRVLMNVYNGTSWSE